MQDPKTLLRVSVIGTVLVALLFHARTGDPAGHLGPGSTYWLS